MTVMIMDIFISFFVVQQQQQQQHTFYYPFRSYKKNENNDLKEALKITLAQEQWNAKILLLFLFHLLCFRCFALSEKKKQGKICVINC